MPGTTENSNTTTYVKKNTVDVVTSKISFEAVIPVVAINQGEDLNSFGKPYQIIEGKHPFDSTPLMEELSEPNSMRSSGTGNESISGTKSTKKDTSSSKTSIKKTASATENSSKTVNALVEEDEDGLFVAEVQPSPLLSRVERPCRPGWAETVLHAETPYQLMASSSFQTHIKYALDDIDYLWCEQNNVPSSCLQRGFTYLEWAYVSSLLQSVENNAHHNSNAVASTRATETVVTPSSRGGRGRGRGNRGRGAARQNNRANDVSGLSRDSSALSLSPAPKGERIEQNAAAESEKLVRPCSVCAQAVKLSRPISRSASPLPSMQLLLQKRQQGRGGGGAVGSAVVKAVGNAQKGLPRLDMHLTQHGIKCIQCDTTAHFRCWGFTEVLDENHWLCDVCYQHNHSRTRTNARCFVCNRSSGGPMLSYHAPFSHSCEDSNESSDAHTDGWCHIVCALSISELFIQYRATVFKQDGKADMTQRPFVTNYPSSPTIKFTKQRYSQHCIYCNSVAPPCMYCSHPNCFESMHPACAAAAHTMEFFPCSSTGASTEFYVGTDQKTDQNHGDESNSIITNDTNHDSNNNNVGLLLWSHCLPYCSQHFGALLNQSHLSSQTLHEQAEKAALKLDLTGKLRKEDDEDYAAPASPVCPVVKRGRGRPPMHFTQMRRQDEGMCDLIKSFWIEKRNARHREARRWMQEINETKVRPIVCASLRPELIKVNMSKVRLSHFLSLVPEWQALLVVNVEGELPIPDDEYTEKSTNYSYRSSRKVSATTRRSSNNAELLDQMNMALRQLDTLQLITRQMKQETALRADQVQLELLELEQHNPFN